MNAEQSTLLYSYEGTKYKQHASLLPLAHPSMQHPLNYSDAGSLRQTHTSHYATLGNSSLGLEKPEALQSIMESSVDFADMTTLMADIHLPQLLNSITDLDLMVDLTASQPKTPQTSGGITPSHMPESSLDYPNQGSRKTKKTDEFH